MMESSTMLKVARTHLSNQLERMEEIIELFVNILQELPRWKYTAETDLQEVLIFFF